MKSDQSPSDREPFMTLASGRIRCRRCQALSKRTKRQCAAPAVREKRVCRFHGGKSTGLITIDGKQRCAQAKTVHGWETRDKRKLRAEKFKEMKILTSLLK